MFVVKNKDFFKTNSEVHNFNTRFKHDLHIPITNFTLFQHGVWYSGVKTYNHLPLTLKELSNDIFKFKAALKKFILKNSFYTLRGILKLEIKILVHSTTFQITSQI
jgi:hypothetical protein